MDAYVVFNTDNWSWFCYNRSLVHVVGFHQWQPTQHGTAGHAKFRPDASDLKSLTIFPSHDLGSSSQSLPFSYEGVLEGEGRISNIDHSFLPGNKLLHRHCVVRSIWRRRSQVLDRYRKDKTSDGHCLGKLCHQLAVVGNIVDLWAIDGRSRTMPTRKWRIIEWRREAHRQRHRQREKQ